MQLLLLDRTGDVDTGDEARLGSSHGMVPFRYGAEPLHCEVLSRGEQLAQVVPDDLHIVVGKYEAQHVGAVFASKGRDYEVLVWQHMGFGARQFDAEAGARGFTVPAGWCGRCGWFVGFGSVSHGNEFVGFSKRWRSSDASP